MTEVSLTESILPAATRGRFQPLRAGILNLWQYDEQELRFHQGRLILRGENGSGKSKALELLLPFLLDADLSPHRLDPFAGTARTMRWNLLEGDRHESRIGYVWLELGCQGEDEDEGEEAVYLTLGCGLRASRRSARVDAWYFTTDLRIGDGLALLTPSRQPLSKDQLRHALAGRGTIYAQGKDYREQVDATLYGLGNDRFAALRHLLLQLRRPHLSEKLDPRRLSELLTQSLPPVDEGLIAQLSEGFERLEHDEAELARVQAATAAVAAFETVYGRYCQGVARSRGAALRQAESAYHATAARVREAENDVEQATAALAALASRVEETAIALETSRGTLHALEQSAAMRAADALRAKEEHAANLESQAAQANDDHVLQAASATAQTEEAAAAHSRAEATGMEVEAPAERALTAATAAGLEAVHASVAPPLSADAAAAVTRVKGVVAAAVREREAVVEAVQALLAARDAEVAHFGREEDRRRAAAAQVEAAGARLREVQQALATAREALAVAFDAWAVTLTVLSLEPEALAQLLAAGEEGPEVLTATLAALAMPRRDQLVAHHTALQAEVVALQTEHEEVTATRDQVAAARDLGPQPSPFRAAAREERAGAPFYLLFDFIVGLSEEESAGLEAALEAAGLLDAWVMPDGRLLAAGTLDTVLRPAPLSGPAAETLASVLLPAAEGPGVEAGVTAEVLSDVLRSIGLEGPAGAAAWVACDGRWQLGPLHGAWSKQSAEHIGAGAREAARRRRLAELDAHLEALTTRQANLEAEAAAIEAQREELAAEVRTVPSAAALNAAQQGAAAAEGDLGRRRDELAEVEAAVAAARAVRDEAEAALRQAGQQHRLSAHLDDLPGYRVRLHAYRALFAEFVQVAQSAQAARAAAAGAAERAEQATAAAEAAAARRTSSRAAAQRARAEVATLHASVGAEAQEIVTRHRAEQARLGALEAERETLQTSQLAGHAQQARAAERQRLLSEELTTRDEARAAAVARLRRLAETGQLALVLPVLVAEAPGGWSARRTLEVARAIEQATQNVDLAEGAANRRANRMHAHYQTLVTELGADFRAGFEHDDDVVVVQVEHNHQLYTVPALHTLLEEEVAARQALLEKDERELLRRFLLGEVGDHLRTRLREANGIVARMNQILAACRTASGMTLKLAWRPAAEAAADVREAVPLLHRDVALLSDADRDTLAKFFQDRIAAARADATAVPWREHLMTALDYRLWYAFRVQRRVAGETAWGELTRHSHAASSGGEKAVLLHLPLFAAAAAHYGSAQPTAPRLIMLDEAFAGIDQGMRGRCMGLLVELDLDFMMTSHDEWGCYEELPGVATYQLYRDPTLGGVAAVRFVWNGAHLCEEEHL